MTSTGGVACADPVKDCPAPANECVMAICDANKLCAVSNVAVDGTFTAQTAGDCKKLVCDGNGATKAIDDNTDINDDAKECTTDICAAGAPVNTPVAAKTPCGVAGGPFKCDAVGNCIVCLDITDCGTPPACKVNTCTAGFCGTADAADASACNDDNACTKTDSCQAGACVGSNPVMCMASDQCHVTGTCNPATGFCSDPNAPNGMRCMGGGAFACMEGLCCMGVSCP